MSKEMDFVQVAKHEFLLDRAEYFKDKPELYLRIKSQISNSLHVDNVDVRICGSAYWGRRFKDSTPFRPGESDLDVALVNPTIFCRCMAEIRDITRNFTDQTPFPVIYGQVSSFEEFKGYAFQKGMIRIDRIPDVRTKALFTRASDEISREFLDHFEKISFILYDSSSSFAVKQANAARKFRGEDA